MTVSTVSSIDASSGSTSGSGRGRVQLPATMATTLRALAAAGFVLMLLGAIAAPGRLWASLLILGYYVFGVGVGALYFLATYHGAGGGWAAVFKRVPEAMLVLVPVGGGLIAAALIGDLITGLASSDAHRLYPWMVAADLSGGHGDGVQSFKDFWLQPTFFYLRALLIVFGVSFFARTLRRLSLEQDRSPGSALTVATRRTSIQFLIVGTVLLSVGAIDWFMSMEPMWYSTMYIVYHFAGNFVTGLAVIVLILLSLRGLGLLPEFRSDHLHDLGKLLFAMSTFWMYIWFSQFMLIWYTNIPEETIYFSNRLGQGRTPFLVALPVLMWVIPFFVLLSQKAKRSRSVMSRVAVVILLGHWLDLFLISGGQAASGGFAVAEVGAGVAAVALVFLLPARLLTRAPLVAEGDPYLGESLHHHV